MCINCFNHEGNILFIYIPFTNIMKYCLVNLQEKRNKFLPFYKIKRKDHSDLIEFVDA